MLRKILFITAHEFKYPGFYKTYKKLMKNQWKNYEEHKREQEKKLRFMINYAYKNVPYYHKLFKKQIFTQNNMKTIEGGE